MHSDQGRCWYSMSASLNRVAADRAKQLEAALILVEIDKFLATYKTAFLIEVISIRCRLLRKVRPRSRMSLRHSCRHVGSESSAYRPRRLGSDGGS